MFLITHKSVGKKEIRTAFPLLLIAIIGIAFTTGNVYVLSKDLYYSIKPVIYFLLGTFMFKNKLKFSEFLGILLLSSVLTSLIHIYKLSTIFGDFSLGINAIRLEAGAGNLMEAFVLAYIIQKRRFTTIQNYLRLPHKLYIALLLSSIILSLSRTIIISFIITLLALSGYFSIKLNRIAKSTVKLGAMLLILIGLLFVINIYSTPGSIANALTSKYLHSFTEISVKQDFTNNSEINKNWRGYESSLVKKEIDSGNIINKIFGFGFGKTVFIGYDGFVGENNSNIPIFHNGFMQIMLKTGLLGLILYHCFFLLLFIQAENITENKWLTSNFYKGLIISTYLTTLVITGIYNKWNLDSTIIVIGYFFSFLKNDDEKNKTFC